MLLPLLRKSLVTLKDSHSETFIMLQLNLSFSLYSLFKLCMLSRWHYSVEFIFGVYFFKICNCFYDIHRFNVCYGFSLLCIQIIKLTLFYVVRFIVRKVGQFSEMSLVSLPNHFQITWISTAYNSCAYVGCQDDFLFWKTERSEFLYSLCLNRVVLIQCTLLSWSLSWFVNSQILVHTAFLKLSSLVTGSQMLFFF